MANRKKDETKAVAESHVEDGEVERHVLRGKSHKHADGTEHTDVHYPVEPANAGSKTRQTQAPVYPDDYDTDGQPNEPQVPTKE
jgi:hypothetical protein